MSNILKIAGAGVSAAAEETDENFNQTVLLLHGDGTDGAQNNTFLDSSTNNFTVTRNGNTTQGTFSPFSAPDGRWSNYFAGTNDQGVNCTISGGLSTGDFTIEYWAYHDKFVDFITHFNNTRGATGFNCGTQSAGEIVWYDGAERVRGTTAMEVGKWYHIAFVRSSGVLKGYLNGVQDGTTYSASTNYSDSTFEIGNLLQSGVFEPMFGMISNLRVVVGSALYTSNFTPPTAPLSPSTSNQQLLACYGNRFADFNTATTAKAITITASPKITPFSPFAPTAAYSASVNGGSGYFDGTSDSLVVDSALLDGSTWTVEMWVYATALGAGNKTLFSQYDPGDANRTIFDVRNGLLTIFNGNQGANSGSTTMVTGQWYHIAFVRSSSTVTGYLNGVQEVQKTNFTGPYSTDTMLGFYVAIGSENDAWSGYISNVRFSDTNKTISSVPTALLTTDGNTSALLNFTNAGIFDQTGKNNLETVGNAQIDTTTKKFGTGSMEFDGTGDYLVIPYSESIDLGGTQPFTIQFWIYVNNLSARRTVMARNNGATAAGSQFDMNLDTNGQLQFYFYSGSSTLGTLSATSAISATTWHYVTFSKDASGNYKIFVDGSQSGSTTTTTAVINQNTLNMTIGSLIAASAASNWNGFIDDLRITKGVARDGTVVPTKEFPNL